MKTFVLASNNKHKLEEFAEIFKDHDIKIISLEEANLKLDIEETGKSFLENSFLKSNALIKDSKFPIISDDSGLEVIQLDGEPGIFSARYAGKNASDKENRDRLLANIKAKQLPKPDARYVCALTYQSKENLFQVEGYCYGTIQEQEAGQNGFGYDPIFYLEKFNKTAAEITAKEKNSVSHRRDAIGQLIAQLKSSNII